MGTEEGAVISVRVQPKASRNACTVDAGEKIRIAVAAPPVDGKANAAVLAYLAEIVGAPKRCVRLIRGETSRDKVIAIDGLSKDEVLSRLRQSASKL